MFGLGFMDYDPLGLYIQADYANAVWAVFGAFIEVRKRHTKDAFSQPVKRPPAESA